MVIHLAFNQTVGTIATKAGIRLSAHCATSFAKRDRSTSGLPAGKFHRV